jgi:hypothetical protein
MKIWNGEETAVAEAQKALFHRHGSFVLPVNANTLLKGKGIKHVRKKTHTLFLAAKDTGIN